MTIGPASVPATIDQLPLLSWDENLARLSWRHVSEFLEQQSVPVSEDFKVLANTVDQSSQKLFLDIDTAPDLYELIKLMAKTDLPWFTNPQLGCHLADKLIAKDENRKAIEWLREIRDRFPESVRTQQLLGLTYRRDKYGDQARSVLSGLREAGWWDPVTLGILAASWKKRYDTTKNLEYLKRAASIYAEASDATPTSEYVAINAAAVHFLLQHDSLIRDDGKKQHAAKAKAYLQRVETILGSPGMQQRVQKEYWIAATLAECHLLNGDYALAAKQYKAAIDLETMATIL